MIKNVYKEYFQKSRVFLYPALDIKKGNSIVPVECYTQWDNKYTLNDQKLICLYHLRSDKEFKAFESKHLYGNKLYDNFFLLDDSIGAYIFDFKVFKQDINNFVNGKYSKLSAELKKKIVTFFAQSIKYTHVHSYLYPEKYFRLYSDLLGVNIDILKEVGELCSPPDLEKENLTLEIKNLHIQNINV